MEITFFTFQRNVSHTTPHATQHAATDNNNPNKKVLWKIPMISYLWSRDGNCETEHWTWPPHNTRMYVQNYTEILIFLITSFPNPRNIKGIPVREIRNLLDVRCWSVRCCAWMLDSSL